MTAAITVLYVDDEFMNLQLFALNFGNIFNVITAESGNEGLDKLRLRPDTSVVISDMRMPGMNGLEFIKTAGREFPGITFFLFTGYDITEEIYKAMAEGIIHKYFRKPFDLKEIENSIHGALKKDSH
jgi:two-component system, response regulator, stage 0 sporulation protein F